MNDRFKFRVWDKPLEKYMEFKEFKFMNVEFTFNPITKEAEIEYDKERYIVEQCTGLKDKNGKLIYEGDICRIKGAYYDCDYKEYFEVDENEKVESLEKFFGEAMLKGVYSALGCDTLQVEVIGNIHKNKDLLEKKND